MLTVLSKNRNNLLVILLAGLFLIELIPTIFRFYGHYSIIRVVGTYKILSQVAFIFLIDYSKIDKKLVKLLIALSFTFLVSVLLNPILKLELSWLILKGSIYYFDRYIFIILFAIMIYSGKDQNIIFNKAFKYIEYILLINAGLIVVGFFFNLKIFESYITSSRFGYDGIFNKVNEVSYIYSIYIVYLYYCCFILKIRHWSFFFIISLVSLMLGTKTVLLLFCLLFVFHFLFVLKQKKILKIAVTTIIIGFIVFFEQIMNFMFNLFPFWGHLQEKHGLLTLLFSKRDILLYNAIDYTNANWNIINYFVGGAFYNKTFAISQMDGPDLFLFFGAIGSIIYLLIFQLIFLKKNNNILNGLIIIVLFCGLLGGGLLMSGMSMILLFLVSCILNNKTNSVQTFI